MGIMRNSWKDFANSQTFTVPMNTNPGAAGLFRYVLVVTDDRMDVIRYRNNNGDYTASIRYSVTFSSPKSLTPSYNGSALTLEYSETIYGGIRVLYLD